MEKRIGICERCADYTDAKPGRLNYFYTALDTHNPEVSFELYRWNGKDVCDSCYDWLVECEHSDAKRIGVEPY